MIQADLFAPKQRKDGSDQTYWDLNELNRSEGVGQASSQGDAAES